MSREYRFRAWHKKEKKMYEVWHWNFHEEMVRLEPNLGFWNLDDLEIMQFTGLKDKNGKEIYEGDIVRGIEGDVSIPETFISKIRWSDEGYRSCWWIDDREISLSKGVVKDLMIEVIGNVYSNPELLNPPS